jgi:hypothetical protein
MEAVGILVAAAVVVICFLIFRALVLWYWRVNEAVELLKSIDSKLGSTGTTAGK